MIAYKGDSTLEIFNIFMSFFIRKSTEIWNELFQGHLILLPLKIDLLVVFLNKIERKKVHDMENLSASCTTDYILFSTVEPRYNEVGYNKILL